jgi:hypothetical protein
MPTINYSKTVIYKLQCRNSDVTYVFIDSTTKPRQKKMYHIKNSENHKQCEPYMTINKHGGWENWDMIILEKFKCLSKDDTKMRVAQWKTPSEKKLFEDSLPKPSISLPTPSISLPNFENSENGPSISLPNVPKLLTNEYCPEVEQNPLQCRYCEKIFTRKDNLRRHQNNVCSREDAYRKLELENKELKFQNQQLQIHTQLVTNGIQPANANNMPMNMSTHNTLNATTIHNTMNGNITNTINSTTNNLNVNIMSFGKEDFSKVYDTKKKRLEVLKHKHSALLYRVRNGRCNKDYPELRNVVIKNLRSDVAHVYKNDIDPHNFVVMSLKEVVDFIMTNDYSEIESDFDKIGHELDAKTRERIGEFIRQMNEDPDKSKKQKQLIKYMIYNLNKDIDTKLNGT